MIVSHFTRALHGRNFYLNLLKDNLYSGSELKKKFLKSSLFINRNCFKSQNSML